MNSAHAHSSASALLSFRCDNVRSFRDGFDLSMLATTLAEPGVSRQISWREGGSPIGVLPAAGIFGANASGKSNALEALDDMRAFVLGSFRSGVPTGKIPRWPFRLDPSSRVAPTTYEAQLVVHEVRHQYGFTFDDDQVVEEWAYRWPHGRASLLFHRSGDEVQFGTAERSRGRAVVGLLRKNALFLSTAAAANHHTLLPLYEWFQRNLLLATTESREARQSYTAHLLEDPGTQAAVLAMLRAADLGLTGVRTRPIDPMFKERMERAFRAFIGDETDDGFEMPPVGEFAFQFTHRGSGAGEDVELEPHDESIGTLVWFGLVGPVLDSLANGSVFLADELDASLHPALVAQLVRLYQSNVTNPRRAQLIFNAHDTSILGDGSEARLLGRDQIWFAEKSNDGSSRLYPLSDLDPRKAEAVERRYLAGRYGGLPILTSGDFDAAVEQFASAH